MDRKRLLVVGAGAMGSMYSQLVAAGRVPEAELAGIVDTDGARALELASTLGCPAFGDIEAAVRQARPDAAYVATPDHLHRQPVEALAAAGIAILVEKPLATTVEDARAMTEAVERAGVHAEVNYGLRWHPAFQEARRAIESGEVGEVRTLSARMNAPITLPRDRLRWSGRTSPAWYLMSHLLDLTFWLVGRHAESVYASGSRGTLAAGGLGTLDSVRAIVRYRGGIDAGFESVWILPASWPTAAETSLRVVGSEGVLEADASHQGVLIAGQHLRQPASTAWYAARLSAFLRSIDGLGQTRVTFHDGLETTRILAALDRSLQSGRAERVEP
ncbi:1,5-anhydro-D-fructose reductase [bacterium HR29]|jgi:predicted dehydrogenase|nr:1,5-anhydro-D-fructose reductase [bacterium HR29]